LEEDEEEEESDGVDDGFVDIKDSIEKIMDKMTKSQMH